MITQDHELDVEENLLEENNYEEVDSNNDPPVTQSESHITRRKPDYLIPYLTSFFGATFFIFVSLKLQKDLPLTAYWSYSIIPFAIMMGTLTAAVRMALANSREKIEKLGQAIIMILVYCVDIFLTFFMILVSLQADAVIKTSYVIIFIPLYFLAAVVGCFVCFIFPGLIHTENQYYKEAVLLMVDYVAGVTALILLALKLDGMIAWRYDLVFAPLFSAAVLHGVFLTCDLIKKERKMSVYETMVLSLSVTFLILFTLKLDSSTFNQNKLSWFVVFSPIDMFFAFEMISFLILLFRDDRKE